MKIKVGDPVFLIIHCFKYTSGKKQTFFLYQLSGPAEKPNLAQVSVALEKEKSGFQAFTSLPPKVVDFTNFLVSVTADSLAHFCLHLRTEQVLIHFKWKNTMLIYQKTGKAQHALTYSDWLAHN